jgi:hypothetical protein
VTASVQASAARSVQLRRAHLHELEQRVLEAGRFDLCAEREQGLQALRRDAEEFDSGCHVRLRFDGLTNETNGPGGL